MKSRFSGLLLVLVITLILVGPAWSEEGDQIPDEELTELEIGSIDCEGLGEKIDIFLALQKAVNRDFATVTDTRLCRVMTEQCEHFFRAARNLQREYRKECDRDYETVEVAKCDYDANPCYPAPVNQNTSRTSAHRRGRVDYLSSVTGVYDVRTLSQ